MIAYPKIRLLGDAPLPKARPTSADRFTRGEDDCLRIEIKGIVRHVYGQSSYAFLEVMSGGRRISIQIPDFQKKPLPNHLLGAQVNVRGACISLLNSVGRLEGFAVVVPTLEDVLVEVPAIADLQASPSRLIQDIPRVNPDDPTGRQVRIEGDVLC
jgi:hypothetical protein